MTATGSHCFVSLAVTGAVLFWVWLAVGWATRDVPPQPPAAVHAPCRVPNCPKCYKQTHPPLTPGGSVGIRV